MNVRWAGGVVFCRICRYEEVMRLPLVVEIWSYIRQVHSGA